MRMIVDTCSWKKIQYLEKEKIISLKPILYQNDLWASHSLIREYKHYFDDYLDFSMFSIQKVNQERLQQLEEYSDQNLDEADLSIIDISQKNDDFLVISDDRAELVVLRAFRIKSFQISEYILKLYQFDIINKKIAKKAIKQLREWRNIQGKKEKKLLNILNSDSN